MLQSVNNINQGKVRQKYKDQVRVASLFLPSEIENSANPAIV